MAAQDHVPADVGEIEGFPPFDSTLAARSGDMLTGYESADGTHWTTVGTARLAGLPATVQAGMFAAAPGSGQIAAQSISGSSAHGAVALAAARFDHLSVSGQRPGGSWAGAPVGGASPGTGFHLAGGTITVTGSGDIAPDVPAGDGTGTVIEQTRSAG